MAERFKALVLKTSIGEILSGVQIPLLPFFVCKRFFLCYIVSATNIEFCLRRCFEVFRTSYYARSGSPIALTFFFLNFHSYHGKFRKKAGFLRVNGYYRRLFFPARRYRSGLRTVKTVNKAVNGNYFRLKFIR